MEPEELSFSAWVLIGNVLTVATGGAAAHRVETAHRERLAALAARLAAATPAAMLAALQALPHEDRSLLLQTAEQCYTALGTEAASVLGLEQGDAAEVLRTLQLDV